MELTWLGKAEARGEVRGIEKGIQKGKVEGAREERARAVEQMRRMVLEGIEQRFGTVSERVQARVQAIETLEPLGKMLMDLALAQSPDDLLPRRGRRRS